MNRVPPIFKNPVFQQQFDTDGYIKLELLDAADIASLSALFSEYFPNPSTDFFSSSYENDFELKKKISNAIGEIMQPKLETVFNNYTWFGSAFLSKGNGARSEMPMHQDWTIVDETTYIAINVWTPLQDTNEVNGTLEVIPGSHKWHSVLRAPTLPFYYNGYQEKLKQKLVPLPAKAGEAVVLNQAVIHYSKPNKTDLIRVAITSGVKTKNAPMLFHYWDKNKPDEIEQFIQDDDFLIRFTEFHSSIFKRPAFGQSNGTRPFIMQQPGEKEIEALTGVSMTTPHTAMPKEKTIGQKILAWITR